jgi:hypothetical protein
MCFIATFGMINDQICLTHSCSKMSYNAFGLKFIQQHVTMKNRNSSFKEEKASATLHPL